MNPIDRMKSKMTRVIATTKPTSSVKTASASLSADRIIARGTALKNSSFNRASSHEVNANIIAEYTKQYKDFIANELPQIIAAEKAKLEKDKQDAVNDEYSNAENETVGIHFEFDDSDTVPEAQGISVGSESTETETVVLKTTKKTKKSKKNEPLVS